MKKILVIIRETFPTNEILNKKNLEEKRVLNPYDEYALLQASKIKEKQDCEIVCLFLAERENQYGLRTALGLGADSGIFVYFNGNNRKEQAEILAKEIIKNEYDMIFMGIRDVNDDREELPYRLGNKLNLPVYPHILSISYENDSFIAEKETEETINTLKINELGIVAFNRNNYEPKYPSILDIITIKNKPIKTIHYDDAGDSRAIVYNDTSRKLNIHKNISSTDGAKEVVAYLKTWRIID